MAEGLLARYGVRIERTESNAAEAQGFANMLNQGASMLSLTAFGWLVIRR